MADLINLAAAREARVAPDPDHVVPDPWGRPLLRFVFSYQLGSRHFTSHIWAFDQAEAEQHIAAIRATADLDGQVFAEIAG